MSPIKSPQSGLAPQSGIERYRLQQWLNFMTSELHKVVFIPLLDPTATEGAKHMRARRRSAASRTSTAISMAANFCSIVSPSPMHTSSRCLIGRDSWASIWRNGRRWRAYFDRMAQRPNVAKAMAEEMALYQEQQARARAKAMRSITSRGNRARSRSLLRL